MSATVETLRKSTCKICNTPDYITIQLAPYHADVLAAHRKAKESRDSQISRQTALKEPSTQNSRIQKEGMKLLEKQSQYYDQFFYMMHKFQTMWSRQSGHINIA